MRHWLLACQLRACRRRWWRMRAMSVVAELAVLHHRRRSILERLCRRNVPRRLRDRWVFHVAIVRRAHLHCLAETHCCAYSQENTEKDVPALMLEYVPTVQIRECIDVDLYDRFPREEPFVYSAPFDLLLFVQRSIGKHPLHFIGALR